jgi:hypothetical protein
MRLMIWFLLAVIGADPPPAAPSQTPPPPTEPAPPADAAPVAAPDARPAADVLKDATDALTARRWADAIQLAAPAISAYPELSASFKAILDVATDQIARVDREPDPEYLPQPPRRPQRPPSRVAWGFEVGLPTGLRFEYQLHRKVVDSVGLRVGANLAVYDETYATVDPSVFVDWRISDTWQIETSTGLIVYYGWMYPNIGAAIQWDPKGPLQVNAGARISAYGIVVPDVGVGFVW